MRAGAAEFMVRRRRLVITGTYLWWEQDCINQACSISILFQMGRVFSIISSILGTSSPSDALLNFSASSWVQASLKKGRVVCFPASTYRLKQKSSSSAYSGLFSYFCMQFSRYLQPLNNSLTSDTLKVSIAHWSHFLPATVQKGLRVLGLNCTLDSSIWLMPQHQFTSAFGRAGTLRLQSRKMSEADFWAFRRVDRWQSSSTDSGAQYLGSLSLILAICSGVASPSMGTKGVTTSSSLNLGEMPQRTSLPRQTAFWQRHLNRIWKAFFSLVESFLKQESRLSSALVRFKCALVPSCRGQPSTSTILIMGSMLQKWKRNVSLSVGWLRYPLLTQYQMATSASICVVTNCASPHKLAMVLLFFSRQSRCSVALAWMGFRYSISPSLMRYQMTAQYRLRLPMIFPPAISLAMVRLPTSMWFLCVPRGIAPSSLFCVKGFLRILSEYLTPVKVEMLALNLALSSGQFKIRRGQAAMSSTMCFSTPRRNGSHQSIRIWGTSQSMMMGHSMVFLERSCISMDWSILTSFAVVAMAILLDLICPMLYCPLKSPQRLIKWLIFFSMSVVASSEKYLRLMTLATSMAPSKLPFSRCSLMSFEQSNSLLIFLDSSFTTRFFMFTSWFFRGMLPDLPMFKAIISPSMRSYLASKFSSDISSRVSRILKSSVLYCTTAASGLSFSFVKTWLSQNRVKGQVTDIFTASQPVLTMQQTLFAILKPFSSAPSNVLSHR